VKVVIAGGGRVGAALSARLVGEKHQVAVVDRDRGVCDRLFQELGVVAVCGDATDPRVLENAGLASADIAAGLLARDADNMAFAMVARASSSARVMVRMLDPAYRAAYRAAGVRDVVAEAEIVVGSIVTAMDFPEVAGSMLLGDGQVILFELVIPSTARMAGLTVAQVRAQSDFPRDSVFIGLWDEEGGFEIPTGQSVLRPGRMAVLAARRGEMAQVIGALTERTATGHAVQNVVAALRRIDFLTPLTDDELASVSRGVELVRKADRQVVFKKGEEGDAFYLVLTGEVTLVNEAGQVVETVRQGGFFGEIALLTGQPRSTTARASGETELAAIGREDFRSVLMANPALALEMSRILGQRLAAAARSDAPRWRTIFSRS
jgi:trk system potassium uptake protein TrkA